MLYNRAKNCVKCGYEINRIALILHLFTLFQEFHKSLVIGVICIVLSYTCVYFGEAERVYKNDDSAAPGYALLMIFFTTASYLLWILNRLFWR